MDSHSSPKSHDGAEPWTHTLNKALIAVGVVAFGLIATDRFLEAYSIDNKPVDAAAVAAEPTSGDENGLVVPAGSEQAAMAVKPVSAPGLPAPNVSAPDVLPAAVTTLDNSNKNLAESDEVTDVIATVTEGVGVKAAAWEVVDTVAAASTTALGGVASGVLGGEGDALSELQNLFGSRVVFVSASEPVYVVTEDERQFELGSLIDDETSLAGVATDQLIIERAGDLTILSLPDPVAQ